MKFRFLPFLLIPSLAGAPVSAEEIPEQVTSFLNTYCFECHDPDLAEGDFTTDFLRISETPEDAEYWSLVLDNLHLGDMPPEDEEKQPAIDELEPVVSWIEAELARASRILAGHTGEVVLRRLNRTEFEYTIEDLFGVRGDFAAGFPEDAEEEGFDNIGAALMLSAEQVDQYLEAADTILEEAIVTSPRPEMKSATFTLHEENKAAWDRFHSLLERRLKEFDDLTANEQRRTRQMQEELEKDPLHGYRFPALVDGKLEKPTPEMGPEVDAVLPQRGGFGSRIETSDHFRVREAGWYKFTLHAYAFQAEEEPARVRIEAGTFRQGAVPRRVDTLALSDPEPKKYEYRLYLQSNERIRVELMNDVRARGRALESLDTPMAAIRSVSMEGPLIEEWPPRGHRLLLGERDAGVLEDEEIPTILSELAPRLFRRPVPARVVDEYVDFYREIREDGTELEAYKLTVKSMMASPWFLYHLEPGRGPDAYALANRLSYFLWRSAPDARLMELADSEELKRPEVIAAEVERLLSDEKGERFLEDFTDHWLHLDQVGQMQPDSALYPEYDEELERAMVGETRSFVREMLVGDLPLLNLVDADWTMLNDRLAKHYGLPEVRGTEFRKVSLDQSETVRGGLLTQASILNVTSNGTTTSPVVRGVFVLDQLLGTPAPPPPPDVPAIEPDIRGATTIQEQLEKHREIAQCSNCHKKIDPYGIALENFDVIGGWRETYRALEPTRNPNRPELVDGQPVAVDDTLPRHGRFGDFEEFIELMKRDERLLYENLAHKLAIFALGRKMDFADEAPLSEIAEETKRSGGGMRTMIKHLVSSELFRRP